MELLKKYFPTLAASQTEQFAAMENLYRDWNSKINVISRQDIDQLYERHVIHSLAIAKFISFCSGTKILDIGTGGGFPGIPLAIFFPEAEFLLADSIAKKIRVVEDVVQQLGLKNVKAQTLRVESLKGKFDFVVSRAVTRLPTMIGWTKHLISPVQQHEIPNGLICLKGGDLNDEISTIKNKFEIIPINTWFSEHFFEKKFVVHLSVTAV